MESFARDHGHSDGGEVELFASSTKGSTLAIDKGSVASLIYLAKS